MTFWEEADERWKIGREERGLSPEDPFEGDPVQEFREEILDGFNYLKVIASRQHIPTDALKRASDMLFELNMLAENFKGDSREWT